MGKQRRPLLIPAVVVAFLLLLLPIIWLQGGYSTKVLTTTIDTYSTKWSSSEESKAPTTSQQAEEGEDSDGLEDDYSFEAEAVTEHVASPPLAVAPRTFPPPQLPPPHPSPPSPIVQKSPPLDTLISPRSSVQEEAPTVPVSPPLDEDEDVDYDDNMPTTTTATASKPTTFLEALANCTTLRCVRRAHKLPRGPATYNFPHAIIIGFQKSATTSTHVYLGKQLNVIKPSVKEPEFFSWNCRFNPPSGCPADLTENYLTKILPRDEFIQSNGTVFTYEGSTHLVRGGPELARGLRKSMPWLKLVIAMREPISRAASMLIHMKTHDRGCLYWRKNLGSCLLSRSQLNGEDGYANNYVDNIRVWLEEWPADQIHFIQYEELTEKENETTVLKDLLRYVGLPLKYRKSYLTLVNTRRFAIRPKGWDMRSYAYKRLVEMVRKDTEELLDLMESYGKLKDRDAWLRRWTEVWDDNLQSCTGSGDCNILLS